MRRRCQPGSTCIHLLTSSSRPSFPHSNPALDFVAAPALAPPEVHLSDADRAQLDADAQAAINAPLPDEVSPRFRSPGGLIPTCAKAPPEAATAAPRLLTRRSLPVSLDGLFCSSSRMATTSKRFSACFTSSLRTYISRYCQDVDNIRPSHACPFRGGPVRRADPPFS